MPTDNAIIDGYELIRVIGVGGFGQVWLCRVLATSEFRAIKWVSGKNNHAFSKELEAIKNYRFHSQRLNSPNLLPVEHVGLYESDLFYVLPLADGLVGQDPANICWQPKTLETIINQRRDSKSWFTSEEICDFFHPLVDAAAVLSDAGLVHRDIKPANVIFRGGVACLSDIGLLSIDFPILSRAGTPGFSAPSWYVESGGNPDLWGLACTLFTLLTGNNPDKMGRGNYRWPPKGESSLSSHERKRWLDFHKIINRATSECPAERFIRITDFGMALKYQPIPITDSTTFSLKRKIWIPVAILVIANLIIVVNRNLWKQSPLTSMPISQVIPMDSIMKAEHHSSNKFKLALKRFDSIIKGLDGIISVEQPLPKKNWTDVYSIVEKIIHNDLPSSALTKSVDKVVSPAEDVLAEARSEAKSESEKALLLQAQSDLQKARLKIQATADGILSHEIGLENLHQKEK